MALRFDARRLRVLGRPEVIIEHVRAENEIAAGQVALAMDGTLIFARGVDAARSRFVRRNRQGAETTLPFDERAYGTFRVTPDGARILARVHPGDGPREVWMLDVVRGTQSKLPVPYQAFEWSPDGTVYVGSFTSKGIVRNGADFVTEIVSTPSGERKPVYQAGP